MKGYTQKVLGQTKRYVQTINLKDDPDMIEEDGKQKRVLNKRETTLAQQKQQAIKEKGNVWILRIEWIM